MTSHRQRLADRNLAMLPLLADLDAAGLGGWDTYWSLLREPTDEALPILLDALTRPDLSDEVRGDVAHAFAARQARPHWDRLLATWRTLAATPDSKRTCERLAVSLSDLAAREHLDDVLAILRAPELGTDRGCFLRTLTRLRYADRWSVIEEATRDPDLTVEASHLLRERAKREAKQSR